MGERLKVKDRIIGTGKHNKDLIREIIEVRDTGYTWKYIDSDNVYYSENSSDPFFEAKWEVCVDNGN